jgi:hypothetical protein
MKRVREKEREADHLYYFATADADSGRYSWLTLVIMGASSVQPGVLVLYFSGDEHDIEQPNTPSILRKQHVPSSSHNLRSSQEAHQEKSHDFLLRRPFNESYEI